MIFIDKQRIAPTAFIELTAGITSYDQLQGQNKQAVIDILLAEQGGLCPLCERGNFGPTLEHFLPRSENPLLELDYHNLYVCCQPCNGPKAHFLTPPYIFDRRFDPCAAQHPTKQHDGVYPLFEISGDDNCYVKVPSAVFNTNSEPKPTNIAGMMLHYTLMLTDQNRQGPAHANLVIARGKLATTLRKSFAAFSDLQILNAWNKIIHARTAPNYRFPPFVSLHIQALSKERKVRGI